MESQSNQGNTREPHATVSTSDFHYTGSFAGSAMDRLAGRLAYGTKQDADKLRYDLVPPDALEEITKVLTFGATKYAARNWENGISWGRVFGALMRHTWAWWRGHDKDEETGLSHMAHAGACVFFLLSYELRGMSSFDDRAKLDQD